MHIVGAYLSAWTLWNFLFLGINCKLASWSSVYESGMTIEPQPGWARFCRGNKVYDTFVTQCPAGIFWDDQSNSQWDCVCTRGAWKRSASWCSDEDTQRFTQGDISCFEPDQEERSVLQGMFYVGDLFSAWDTSLPVLLSDYKSGVPIRSRDLSNQWQILSRVKMNPGVLIYRPRDDWTVEDKNNNATKLCLRAPSSTEGGADGLFIYSASALFDPSGGPQTFQLSITRGCQSWVADENPLWQNIQGENLQEKNMIVPAYNSQTASEKCQKCMSQPIPAAPAFDADGEQPERREGPMVYDLKNVAVLKTEIDLQTERIGQHWAHKIIQNETDEQHNIGHSQELEILTKAALIAYTVCNNSLVPFEFYQYFLIMFQSLTTESFKKYPPNGPINAEYLPAINDLFRRCKDRSRSLSFTLGQTCPVLFEEFSNGTTDNFRRINITSDYTSDKARHDYLLEFIWRLKTFLHYWCFEEFQSNSILHDVVQHQLESLISEDLILRWYNPGNSFQMYRLLFQNHLNLEATMKNFQRCIIASHEVSRYPVWLKRPIDKPEVSMKGPGPAIRLKRSADREVASSEYYGDDSEDSIRVPNDLFGGAAACLKSIRTFIADSKRPFGPQCW